MDRILKGVLKYNATSKAKYVSEMNQYVKKKLQPVTVFFSCMDSRVLPSRFVDSNNGQMFLVRNAGNMVPQYQHYANGVISTESAGLELGCLVNDIDNVVVCGHSDCKAANLLYDLRHKCDHRDYHLESPLKTWVTLHGGKTVEKFLEAVSNTSDHDAPSYEPLVCSFHIGKNKVTAHIDPENKFDIKDKFSQLHCLQQASHVGSYPFLQERVDSGYLRVFAMWFDIHKGDVYLFSPKLEQFMLVDEDSVHDMLS